MLHMIDPTVYLCGTACLLRCECLTVVSRPLGKTLLFIWYIVYRQPYFLTAGQRICGLRGILRVLNSLSNNNNNNNVQYPVIQRRESWPATEQSWPSCAPWICCVSYNVRQNTRHLNDHFSQWTSTSQHPRGHLTYLGLL